MLFISILFYKIEIFVIVYFIMLKKYKRMQSTTTPLTNQEMIDYYMHKVDTGENIRDKKMNKIFYKKSKKCKLNIESDPSFYIMPIDSTPNTYNTDRSSTSCLFCIPIQWPKIFDINDK